MTKQAIHQPRSLKTDKAFFSHYGKTVESFPPQIAQAYMGRFGRAMCFDFYKAHTPDNSHLYEEIESYMKTLGFDYLYASQERMAYIAIFEADGCFENEDKFQAWRAYDRGQLMFTEVNIENDTYLPPMLFEGLDDVQQQILRRRHDDSTLIYFGSNEWGTIKRLLDEKRLDLVMAYHEEKPAPLPN